VHVKPLPFIVAHFEPDAAASDSTANAQISFIATLQSTRVAVGKVYPLVMPCD
jgi:hypothetical protein